MTRVLCAVDGLSPDHLAALREPLDGWATFACVGQAEADRALGRADVHVGWASPEAVAASAVRLHLLPSVGYEGYARSALAARPGFALCNARGVMGVPVAEHALALMLALARQIPHHVRDRDAGRWARASHYDELLWRTVVVVGLGDVGTEIARRCLCFGMHVVGVDPTLDHALVEDVRAPGDLLAALAEANWVVSAVPETPETRGLFGAEAFAALPEGARFVNVSRGGVVDEGALADALISGRLAGAALDVFAEEPPPPSSPFWTLENVMMTPHAAGRSPREFDRLAELFADNLARYRDGRPLRNRVLGADVAARPAADSTGRSRAGVSPGSDAHAP